jgi:hypothetical protein
MYRPWGSFFLIFSVLMQTYNSMYRLSSGRRMLRCVSRLPFSLSDSVVYFCVILAKKGSFCGPCTLWVLRRFLSSCFLSSRHSKIPISVTRSGCSSAILYGHHYLEVCTALANVFLSNEADFRHSTLGFLASKRLELEEYLHNQVWCDLPLGIPYIYWID